MNKRMLTPWIITVITMPIGLWPIGLIAMFYGIYQIIERLFEKDKP